MVWSEEQFQPPEMALTAVVVITAVAATVQKPLEMVTNSPK